MKIKKIIEQDMELIYKQILEIEKIKNKSILVTGATGMLAKYLVNFFCYLNKNYSFGIKIYILARSEKKVLEVYKDNLEYLEVIIQDITQKIELKKELDIIFHLASSASPHVIINNPLSIIEANIIGTKNVLELARKTGAIVNFASTREVYGEVLNEKSLITEKDMGKVDCLEDRACYPESKRLAETLCRSYYLQYGVNYQILRIAHIYGPGMILENDGRIMSDIISSLVEGKNIILKSSGEVKRSFCYITDAISGMLKISLSGEKNEVYNLANEKEEISIKNLAELGVELFEQKNIKVIYTQNILKNGYTNYKRTGLDCKKIENLGWSPKISLREGIERTVISFQERKKIWKKYVY